MGSATPSTINVGFWSSMYDPTGKQLVWTGQATENQKNLNKAMQKLLKDFPPK